MSSNVKNALVGNATKISLNDRFSKLEKPKRVGKVQVGVTVGDGAPPGARKSLRQSQQRSAALNANNNAGVKGAPVNRQRAQIKNQLNASTRSKRLAAQMANRPTVHAALKIKKRSIRQRLGTAVDAPGQQIGNKPKLPIAKRLGPMGAVGFARGRGRGRGRGRAVGARIGLARRQAPTTPAYQKRIASANLNDSAKGPIQARLSFDRVQRRGAPGLANRARANFNRNQRRGNQRPVINEQNANNENRPRFTRGMNRRGMQRGGRVFTNSKFQPIQKNGLNNDLTKTKTNLDADLDSYMAQAP